MQTNLERVIHVLQVLTMRSSDVLTPTNSTNKSHTCSCKNSGSFQCRRGRRDLASPYLLSSFSISGVALLHSKVELPNLHNFISNLGVRKPAVKICSRLSQMLALTVAASSTEASSASLLKHLRLPLLASNLKCISTLIWPYLPFLRLTLERQCLKLDAAYVMNKNPSCSAIFEENSPSRIRRFLPTPPLLFPADYFIGWIYSWWRRNETLS